MADEWEDKKFYRKELPIEPILGGQLTRIAVYRDTNLKQYASSIDTMILLCPDVIRKEMAKKRSELNLSSCEYENINPDKMRLYDDLWALINNELEIRNLIYKKSKYEIGHD